LTITELKNEWKLYGYDAAAKDLLIISHGTWDGKSWTKTPGMINFYQPNGQVLYNAEIHQVMMGREKVLDVGNKRIVSAQRSATSIAGPGTEIWDYSLTPFDRAAKLEYYTWYSELAGDRQLLENGKPVPPKDLAMARMTAPKIKLSDLFAALGQAMIPTYDTYHYCCCRTEDSLLGGYGKNRTEADPASIYQKQSNLMSSSLK